MTVHDNFLIRDYRLSDYLEVNRIWELTGLGYSGRGDDDKTIADTINAGGRLLVLEDTSAGLICGTSWMTCDGRRIHLHHFAIKPDYQGKGLSKILLADSLRFVKEKKLQVKIEVHSENTKALNLYRKFGFKHLGDYDIYIIRDLNDI